PQGGRRRPGARRPRRPSRPGPYHLGDGSLRQRQALARQADASHLLAAGHRQMPALLLLLHYFYFITSSSLLLLHYFYFIDAELGLIYLRVPTPAFARAGFGVRSASSSIATGTAGWPANSPQPRSVSPWPTTPWCTSTTGRARRPSPIPSRPTTCIASSIIMPSSAVGCSTCSRSPTTGVSCRPRTPPIWCSARQPS